MNNLCSVGEVVFSRRDVVDQAEIDEMWDDTALIEAYDKAVNMAYDAAHASLKSKGDLEDVELLSHNRFNKHSNNVKNFGENFEKTQKSRKEKRKRKVKKCSAVFWWKVGDSCLAKYAEDGFWYEATIISMNRPKNKCVIKFNGYETEQEQNIGGLHRIPESSVENKAEDSADESSSALDTGSVVSDAAPSCASSFKTTDSSMHNLGNKSPKFDTALQKHMTFLPPPVPPAFLQHSSTPSENEAMASMLMSWYMNGYHTGYYQAIRDVKTRKLDK